MIDSIFLSLILIILIGVFLTGIVQEYDVKYFKPSHLKVAGCILIVSALVILGVGIWF